MTHIESIWSTLPPHAPGLTKAHLIALIAAQNRVIGLKVLETALTTLRANNSLRSDGAQPSRYWRGPCPPITSAAKAAGDSPWPRRDEELGQLWDAGHSTPEIARRMGLTKNSIVGRAHRIGLEGRASPIIRDETAVRRLEGKDRINFIAMWRNGVGVQRLSEAFRASKDKVRVWRDELGLPARDFLLVTRERMVAAAPVAPKPPPASRVRAARTAPRAADPYVWNRPHGRCQWIVSEHPVMMCSAEVEVGETFCPKCRRAAYTPGGRVREG